MAFADNFHFNQKNFFVGVFLKFNRQIYNHLIECLNLNNLTKMKKFTLDLNEINKRKLLKNLMDRLTRTHIIILKF